MTNYYNFGYKTELEFISSFKGPGYKQSFLTWCVIQGQLYWEILGIQVSLGRLDNPSLVVFFFFSFLAKSQQTIFKGSVHWGSFSWPPELGLIPQFPCQDFQMCSWIFISSNNDSRFLLPMQVGQCSKKAILHCHTHRIDEICWKRVKDVNPFCALRTVDLFSTRVSCC